MTEAAFSHSAKAEGQRLKDIWLLAQYGTRMLTSIEMLPIFSQNVSITRKKMIGVASLLLGFPAGQDRT